MEGLRRTNYCGEFTIDDVGKEVVVCGWVQRQRDLGHLIFVDLRDRTGIVQLAFSDETDEKIFKKAFSVRAEFVLAAKGVVRERSSKNLQIKTGEIEIDVTDLRVLSVAETPPFEAGDAAAGYNRAQFQSFMPGYEQPVTSVDGSGRMDGHFEVRHENGSGTMFYDTSQYAPPRGDYQVYEDVHGSQWYAVHGEAAVERKPVYENGKPVYDGENVRTGSTETVRYKSTPSRYGEPKSRDQTEIKSPRRRR